MSTSKTVTVIKYINNNPFSKEMREKYPNAYFITHNDNDGNASAMQFIFTEADFNKAIITFDHDECKKKAYSCCNNTYNIDYANDITELFESIEPNSRVFITDYSISNNANAKAMKNLLTREDVSVTWIDHHVSSMNSISAILMDEENLPERHNIYISLFKDAACKMVQEFLHEVTDKEKQPLQYTYSPIVDYTNLWDTFRLKEKEYVVEVKYGIESYPHISDKGGVDAWYHLYVLASDLGYIIDRGTIICNYLDNINKNKYKKDIYETKIAGYNCIAINSKQHESRVFTAIFKELDPNKVYMVWSYSGPSDKYIFSLYSSTKSEIDCSKIAMMFNGGGHPHAAGFSMDNMIFNSSKRIDNMESFIRTIKQEVKDNDLEAIEKHKIVMIEECCEVSKEICKGMRGKLNKENLIEEFGDLKNITESAKILFDFTQTDIDRAAAKKINRYVNDTTYVK